MNFVVALDGDVLVPEDQSKGMQGQKAAVDSVVESLGVIVQKGHQLLVTHGNGPQIGFMLFRAELAGHILHALPLDVCGADTQGATGYMLQQAFYNWLQQHGLHNEVATIVTQVVVQKPDPSSQVTKGIGPYFDAERAHAYKGIRGWSFSKISGGGYQRTVPLLMPERIIEMNTIRYLLDQNVVVICAGGGGIPVLVNEQGSLVGTEAVVDKAYTTALLGSEIRAEKIIFVSRRSRLEKELNLNLKDGMEHRSLTAVEALLERTEKIEDISLHKLNAAKKFLNSGGSAVMIIPPEQMCNLPDQCSGMLITR